MYLYNTKIMIEKQLLYILIMLNFNNKIFQNNKNYNNNFIIIIIIIIIK